MIHTLTRFACHIMFPKRHSIVEMLYRDGTVTRTCVVCGELSRQTT